MNPLQEYPLEEIVEQTKRRPNGKVLGSSNARKVTW